MLDIKSNLIKHFFLPFADKTMKTEVASFYKQIKLMQEWTAEDIIKWQNNNFQELIKHAYNQTVYYNKVFKKYGLTPSDFVTPSDLKKLPILTKKDIRENFNNLIPGNINEIPFLKSSTGGSTGEPAIFYSDKKSWSYTVANTIFNWEKTGYKYGDKYIALGSTSLFVNKSKSFKHQLYYWMKGKIGLNGVNMSDEVCKNYIQLIKKQKIHFLYGYASSIYLLAKYVLNNKIDLNIIACYPTSEILQDVYRDTIVKAFKCTILDCYGARDGGITAYEHDSGFYQVGYNSMFHQEFSDEKNIGPILVTDLLSFAMPFINYQIGDEIQVKSGMNKNYHYNGQVINKVLGRISDLIELENGSTITGPGFTILFKDLPVDYYNISKTGVNTITCRIKKLPNYNYKHEKLIKETFEKQMGRESKINIEYTEEVVFSKSGKRKYFNN